MGCPLICPPSPDMNAIGVPLNMTRVKSFVILEHHHIFCTHTDRMNDTTKIYTNSPSHETLLVKIVVISFPWEQYPLRNYHGPRENVMFQSAH